MARQAIRESKYLMMRALASDRADRSPVRRGSEWATDFVIARRDAEADPVRRETLQGLVDSGYKVIPSAVSLDMVSSLLSAAERSEDETIDIFQRKRPDGASASGDRKRHQYIVPQDATTGGFDVWRLCHSLLSTFFSPRYVVVSPSFLYSDPGCAQQTAHRDFFSDVYRWRTDFPISALVALEQDTKFVAFESKCRGNGVNETGDRLTGDVTPKELTLSPGTMLMWHGNLVHAGGAYPDRPNRRLFFCAVAPDDATSIPLDYTFHPTVPAQATAPPEDKANSLPSSDPAAAGTAQSTAPAKCGSGTASMFTLLEDAMCAQKGQSGRVADIGWSKTAAYGIAVGVADYYNPLGILGVATGSLFRPNAVSNWFDKLTSNVNNMFGEVAIGERGPVSSPADITRLFVDCEGEDAGRGICEKLSKIDKVWQYIPINYAMMKTVNLVHKLHERTSKLKIKGKSIGEMELTAVASVGAFATAYVTELIQIVTFKKVSVIPVVSMWLSGLHAAFDVVDNLFPWLKFATNAVVWLEKAMTKVTCKLYSRSLAARLFGIPKMCLINRPPFLQAYHETLEKEALRLKAIADAPDATVKQKDEYHEFERLRWAVYDRIKRYFKTNEDAVTFSFMFDVVVALSGDESEEFYKKIAREPRNWVKANPKNEEAFRIWAMDDSSIKKWIERLKTDEQKAAEAPIAGNTTYQF